MKTEEIKIAFVGDLYLKEGIHPSFKGEEYLHSMNLVIANLEGPILKDVATKPAKKVGASLYQSREIFNFARELNIKAVACANNHIFDYEEKGLFQTLESLDENGIDHFGAGVNEDAARKPYKVNKSKVFIVNAAEEEFGTSKGKNPGYYGLYSQSLNEEIKQIANKGNTVIAVIHGGGEMYPFPSLSFVEKAKELIDFGASLVVGHHSHVPFGYQRYKNGYIYYGLGNFFHSFYRESVGLVLAITLEKGKLTRLETKKVRQRGAILSIEDLDIKLKSNLEIFNEVITEIDQLDLVLDRQAKDMFDAHYRDYFGRIFLSKTSDFINREKRDREAKDALLLLHLLVNKTHLEFCVRAIESSYLRIRKVDKGLSRKYKTLKKYINRSIKR